MSEVKLHERAEVRGHYWRPVLALDRTERCPLCFAGGLCTVGIGRVMMCSPCFAVFNQHFAQGTWLSGGTLEDQEETAREVAGYYRSAKLKYLERLRANVDKFIEQQQDSLPADAEDLCRSLLEHFEHKRRSKETP